MELKQKIFVTIGTVAVLAMAVMGGAALLSNKDTATGSGTGSNGASSSVSLSADTTSSSSASTSGTSSSGSYKDGTYTKTVSYQVPHGYSNSIRVTLVVSGGKITSATTDNSYSDHESGAYIGWFESSVSSDASGQPLASYSPSRIGGASLTTNAFSEAIDAIKTDATA